jgi:D-amino-acid dehydrogenase
MKVLVMGAGVIGTTTAYYLAREGCEVTVVDRQPSAGVETSFANAGEISPGYASPWAGPGVPFKAVRWMLDRHGPLVVHPQFNRFMWRWVLQTLRNCTAHRYALNKSRMVPIAEYSRDCLRELRSETGISYYHRSRGTLQLFRKASQLDGIGKDVEVLRQYGVPFEVLDPTGCIAAEPALSAVRGIFAGGLRLPDDETGDCYVFTKRLMELAQGIGVRFASGTLIERLHVDGTAVSSVATSAGPMTADAYVMALASFSPLLLRPVGVDIPVYPIKGYSITVPVADDAGAPQSTVMDETYKVAITRLGERIRVGGTAEVGSYRIKLSAARRATLDRSLNDLFPRGGKPGEVVFWSGLRPMTPDGPPIIGATKYANLYLNTGHGTLGWTMACGAARVVTDLLLERKPEIPVDGLSLERYRWSSP